MCISSFMQITYIYALKDPETKQIRYIGRSKNPKKRLYEHHQVRRIHTKSHHNNWIWSLLERGLRAEMEILEECDETNWSERERYWISTLSDLTNTTAGGEGEFRRYKERQITEETKKKVAETVSRRHKDGCYDKSYDIFSKGLQGKKKKNGKSIYCGVHKSSNKFVAQIRNHSETIYIGMYETETDAAIAYDIKAVELFGPTARLNFPDQMGKLSVPISAADGKLANEGVAYNANRWQVTVWINYRRYYLGRFRTEAEGVTERRLFIQQFPSRPCKGKTQPPKLLMV